MIPEAVSQHQKLFCDFGIQTGNSQPGSPSFFHRKLMELEVVQLTMELVGIRQTRVCFSSERFLRAVLNRIAVYGEGKIVYGRNSSTGLWSE